MQYCPIIIAKQRTPNDYKFLGYYNYRRQQPDFTFSFEIEACNLSVELEKLIKGNYSREIKTAANRLPE
ncbi:unnamed protein product [Rhizophagus irregularis]|nr:unnamed protein product [Rhizophagus irregularis]